MEWRPIEEAPLEGEFLAGYDRGLFAGRWKTHIAIQLNGKFFDRETKKRIYATHCKPMPEPPK